MSNNDKCNTQLQDDLSSVEFCLLIKKKQTSTQCLKLDSLKHQTSNISYLVEAIDVLLERTNKSIFEYYKTSITNTIIHMDKQFNTLTCIMNKILDCLECIEFNQVVKAQQQPHTKPEKVKEGEKSLFFDSPPYVVNTPYHAADTPFTEHLLFFPLVRPTSLDSPSFSSKIPTGLLT
ncbi:hypothetical protein QOT17_018977 [Balamuthia mandrillaris]